MRGRAYWENLVKWFFSAICQDLRLDRYWRIEEDVYLRLSMDMSEVSVQEVRDISRIAISLNGLWSSSCFSHDEKYHVKEPLRMMRGGFTCPSRAPFLQMNGMCSPQLDWGPESRTA